MIKRFRYKKSVRSRAEYQWAYNVKIRDKFTCQICGNSKRGNLQTHHIYARNAYIKLRKAKDNGITLCKACHKEFHNIYGKGNNNLKQFIFFCWKYKIDIVSKNESVKRLSKLKV